VGWKFEVQGDRASAIRKAGEQIAECRMDACVANGPAYGDGYGLVRSSGQWEHCETRAGLFGALARLIEG
jgi:phosphopantothenoylcysteine decarboxylase/phosphopantothenate--cysteine ligase